MAQPAQPRETTGYAPPTHDLPADVEPGSVGADGVTTTRGIEYAKVQGYRPLRMELRVPASLRPVPVVVYIHGGAFLSGSLRRNWVADPIWTELLDAGIAVASVEYRLSGEAPFPACLHDIKAAIRWLRTFGAEYGIRPEAIATWGESAGAYLAAFAGLNNDEPRLCGEVGVLGVHADVRAAVAWYPPTDFLSMDEQAGADAVISHDAADSPESLLVGAPLQEAPAAARFASPRHQVSDRSAPILLAHGRLDRLVPCEQSVILAVALTAAGRPVELDIVQGAGHVFDGVDRGPLVRRATEFLRTHLSN